MQQLTESKERLTGRCHSRGGPQWGQGSVQQHENAGLHCPSRRRGRFESDFDGLAWFRAFPWVMGLGYSSQDTFTKMKGEEMWCWGCEEKMSSALPFPNCHCFPSVFDECPVRCYAVFHQYFPLDKIFHFDEFSLFSIGWENLDLPAFLIYFIFF